MSPSGLTLAQRTYDQSTEAMTATSAAVRPYEQVQQGI
jgi:hypothetical protein